MVENSSHFLRRIISVSKIPVYAAFVNVKVTVTAFTRCRHILKMVKNVTAAKFELAFTRYRNDLKMIGTQTPKSRCKTLMLKKCTYTLRIDLSRSKSVQKCSVFIIFRCLHDSVSKMCRLEFCFQNLPTKNVPFSCEREVYPSHFSPFSKCASIV